MQGILVVDKPAGWTSFDVIAKLRGVLGTRKLGHSGTLDPMATGVLPVFCGGASKAVDLQENHDKTYRAVIRLGLRTDTGDITGTVLETAPVTAGEAELLTVLPQFLGAQQQLPPLYSAVKIHGQPLYKLARRGMGEPSDPAAPAQDAAARFDVLAAQAPRTPRAVTIYDIRYAGSPAPGDYALTVRCSKGTYIRTLAESIGQAMGQKATLAALRRTQAGCFSEDSAHTLEEILAAKQAGTLETLLLPVDTIFRRLPALTAEDTVRRHLETGCPTSRYPAADGVYRVYAADGAFLGLAEVREGVLNVKKLFCEREA